MVFRFLLSIAWLFVAFYFTWEYYWFSKVNWHFVRWHTHLAPFALAILLLLTLTQFVQIKERTVLLTSSVCIGLALAEVLLFARNPNGDVMFISQLKTNPTNYYHAWPANATHYLKKEEFNYQRHTNSLGFSDKEWRIEKDTSKIRVLSLGDSFTEGDAAPADSAYPFLMQKILGESYEVMNAGTCGSDPLFNYKNLEDRLLQYKPDIVVQTISTNDLLNDLPLRGGFERFQPNDKIKENSPPAWFYPAMISVVFRTLLTTFNNNIGKAPVIDNTYLTNLETILQQLTFNFDNLGKQHDMKIIFVLLPLKNEVQNNKYDYNYLPLQQMAAQSNTIRTLDLLPCYAQKIHLSGSDFKTFYWQIDQHHNSTGYKLMAECIAEKVLRITEQ
jgi:lysophospholipase L1-like esterase